MNVRFENEIKVELFCNIGIGDCFAVDLNTPDQLICMRIMGCGDEWDNAVELQNGEAVHFDDDEKVIPIKAELKVRFGG